METLANGGSKSRYIDRHEQLCSVAARLHRLGLSIRKLLAGGWHTLGQVSGGLVDLCLEGFQDLVGLSQA